MKVYVVYTAIDWEGIQEIVAVWASEDDAKAHVASLDKSAYIDVDYVELEMATTATPEPGSASANELQA